MIHCVLLGIAQEAAVVVEEEHFQYYVVLDQDHLMILLKNELSMNRIIYIYQIHHQITTINIFSKMILVIMTDIHRIQHQYHLLFQQRKAQQ